MVNNGLPTGYLKKAKLVKYAKDDSLIKASRKDHAPLRSIKNHILKS